MFLIVARLQITLMSMSYQGEICICKGEHDEELFTIECCARNEAAQARSLSERPEEEEKSRSSRGGFPKLDGKWSGPWAGKRVAQCLDSSSTVTLFVHKDPSQQLSGKGDAP
jgi:hypothetical protein